MQSCKSEEALYVVAPHTRDAILMTIVSRRRDTSISPVKQFAFSIKKFMLICVIVNDISQSFIICIYYILYMSSPRSVQHPLKRGKPRPKNKYKERIFSNGSIILIYFTAKKTFWENIRARVCVCVFVGENIKKYINYV